MSDRNKKKRQKIFELLTKKAGKKSKT